jgi:glutathione S-transferase
MKLYDLKTGLNTRRVRIFLAEKGLEIPRVEVDMAGGENRRPEYLAKNPMGTMPLLELDDGTLIAESVAICRYFEMLHPDPPLFGVGALGQAAVEMWNRRMEIELMRPLLDNFIHLSPFWKGRRVQMRKPDMPAARWRKPACIGLTKNCRGELTLPATATRSPT